MSCHCHHHQQQQQQNLRLVGTLIVSIETEIITVLQVMQCDICSVASRNTVRHNNQERMYSNLKCSLCVYQFLRSTLYTPT